MSIEITRLHTIITEKFFNNLSDFLKNWRSEHFEEKKQRIS